MIPACCYQLLLINFSLCCFKNIRASQIEPSLDSPSPIMQKIFFYSWLFRKLLINHDLKSCTPCNKFVGSFFWMTSKLRTILIIFFKTIFSSTLILTKVHIKAKAMAFTQNSLKFIIIIKGVY